MPANDPFLPKSISDFLNLFNDRRSSRAEKLLHQATQQISGTMDVFKNGVLHPRKEMGLDAQEANFLADTVADLGMQHNRPFKALDIGTFTGRSALAMAQAIQSNLPQGGRVISCDISDEFKELVETCWKEGGVRPLIDYRIADAKETIRELLNKGQENTFDLVFIDAEKTGYKDYYENALKLLRPGGKIILDNMLWSGHVAEEKYYKEGSPDFDPSAKTLHDLNEKIAGDHRVKATLLSIGDGTVVARKLDPKRFIRSGTSADYRAKVESDLLNAVDDIIQNPIAR